MKPVLERVDRHDDQDSLAARVAQETVHKRHDLQRLAETHAVCEDAAKTIARLVLLQRLDQVVVQETNSTDLGKKRNKTCNTGTVKLHGNTQKLS